MTDSKITLREKVGYSLGDVAANLVFQMMMIFQLKFYTDIFGLDGAIAGSVLLVARIADAFVDPAVGIITDRTETRWGKYRPWVLWTSVPFCVFYVLAFWNPGIEDKWLVAVYATVSYVLLMTMYSFNNTPYSSLGGVMTGDIRERTSITSIRFVGSTIAQFVVQGFTLPLVSKFGGGDDRHGWLCTIGLFAAVCLVCFIVTFLSARERIAPPPHQKTNIREDVRELVASVSWRSMFVLTLFVFITLAMWGSAMSFYFQSVVCRPGRPLRLHRRYRTGGFRRRWRWVALADRSLQPRGPQRVGRLCHRLLSVQHGWGHRSIHRCDNPFGLSGKQIRQEENLHRLPLAHGSIHGHVLFAATFRCPLHVCAVRAQVAGLRPYGPAALGNDWRRGRPYRVCQPPPCHGTVLLRRGVCPKVRPRTRRGLCRACPLDVRLPVWRFYRSECRRRFWHTDCFEHHTSLAFLHRRRGSLLLSDNKAV